MKSPIRFLVLTCIGAILSLPLSAVNVKSDGWPWNLKYNGWHDREIVEELGKGWFLNVGPTGIRAEITEKHSKYFTVRYVFKNSPAHGKVEIGDLIVGANGTKMNVSHKFGRGAKGESGWDGPMAEMAPLIEDSQANGGQLELIIWKGGKQTDEAVVPITIQPRPRFSETYPFDCSRSDQLMTDLLDFLVEDYERAGKFERQIHTHSTAVLALMASPDEKYMRLVDDIMKGYYQKRYDPLDGAGFKSWTQGYDGIVMGEYYLKTGDRRLLPAIESLTQCYIEAQEVKSGGYSHRPNPFIMRRRASGGPKGYGAMALPGALAMTAMSLFKEAGLDEYGEPAYSNLHQAFLRSVGDNGSIGYGFESLDHAVIILNDSRTAKNSSPGGIGYPVESGMKDIGDYEIQWPTKKDPRWRPTDWVAGESETNLVYDYGGRKRLVIRNQIIEEPKRPYRHDDSKEMHHLSRPGAGALAHRIGNQENESWRYLSDLMATGCAKNAEHVFRGHASTLMHVSWGSLGAALASEEDFREYMDALKWWFIMTETHDGGFVVIPGRDYASTDHAYGTRIFPTATAVLMLSVKDRQLQITGAYENSTGQKTTQKSSTSQRPARSLIEARREFVDHGLMNALERLNSKKMLQPLLIDFSKARKKVWLKEIKDQKLIFSSAKGEHEAAFEYTDLNNQDKVNLSRMAAQITPDNGGINVLAGIFLEIEGETELADAYYERADEKSKALLKAVFE
ncbi:hypothetical protein DDZ13_03795 [Coraliomargarita sinensis]|uniref:PDZ domain-containing protein n=1 Tax=Coraliomargarita sinensis TaxID=2174842 RepID=A0A317ZHQ6_9BACT|nr:DUF6288 domain-containing protein [Coraliomargarita sinensis]PXA05096.1 hypothetical protein DDZ13_03795 [Coraliomargarita sinensis]